MIDNRYCWAATTWRVPHLADADEIYSAASVITGGGLFDGVLLILGVEDRAFMLVSGALDGEVWS
jgi:hypothetical protein